MKKIFSFILLCTLLMTVNTYAQSHEDVVYLTNGSILRGKVIDNKPGEKISIEMVGNNLIVIPDSLVIMIMMNQAILSGEGGNTASAVEMAANVSFYGGSNNSAGLTFITAYHFPFRLSAGAGVGIEWFDHQQIPLMTDFKYYFMKGPSSLYVYAQGGYAFPLSTSAENEWSDTYGGILAGTGGGLRINFSKHNALVFSIGYRYQKTKTVTESYPWYSSTYLQYETIRYDEFNRLTFSFGFLFN